MAPKTHHLMSPRAAHQLRRIRVFYAAAALLWAAAAVWTGQTHPGTRQMWVSVVLLAVFVGLLGAVSLWMRNMRVATGRGPTHHAAPRRAVAPRHAKA